MLEKEPQLVQKLADNARFVHKGIAKIPNLKVRPWICHLFGLPCIGQQYMTPLQLSPHPNHNTTQVRSDEASPLIHVGLDPALGLSVEAQKKALRAVSRKCVDAGYAIGTYHLLAWAGPSPGGSGHISHICTSYVHTVTSKYKLGEAFEPPPSLRLSVSAIHTQQELKGALDALKSAVASALKK